MCVVASIFSVALFLEWVFGGYFKAINLFRHTVLCRLLKANDMYIHMHTYICIYVYVHLFIFVYIYIELCYIDIFIYLFTYIYILYVYNTYTYLYECGNKSVYIYTIGVFLIDLFLRQRINLYACPHVSPTVGRRGKRP